MRFLVDNSVSWRVADALNKIGHDAVHVRDIGMGDSEDGLIYQRAVAESRIIVTQDMDFGTLLAMSEAKAAVILFRMSQGKSAVHIGIIQRNLARLESELLPGTLVVFTDTAIRVRRWADPG